MIAGGIAIEQMLEEPVGARLPVHPAPVHQVGGHPHPRVVVQPTRAHQLLAEAIHAGQAGAALADVVRQFSAVGGGVVSGLERLLIVFDAVPQLAPHPLPEVAPAQLIDQLAAVIAVADPLEHGIAHLRQGEYPMADVRRETGHGSVEVVAAAAVAPGIHLLELSLCSLASAADATERALRLGEGLNQKRL